MNLYKISHTQARLANYEKLLSILNDCLQGKARHLAVLVGGTPQMVEDPRRGLFSYDAIRTRLQESRFASQAGLRDVTGPIIALDPLSFEEVFVLLQNLRRLHATYHNYPERVADAQLKEFMEETLHRLGAQRFSTPREVIRDFVTVLNLMQQNPSLDFSVIVHGADYKLTPAAHAPSEAADIDAESELPSPTGRPLNGADDKFKEFTL